MLNKLKILLLENNYPFFSDEELQLFLDENNNKVYKTASILCHLKADGDKKIVVGPITIEGPGADFWINLSEKYSKQSDELETEKDDNVSSSGYYINRMQRRWLYGCR